MSKNRDYLGVLKLILVLAIIVIIVWVGMSVFNFTTDIFTGVNDWMQATGEWWETNVWTPVVEYQEYLQENNSVWWPNTPQYQADLQQWWADSIQWWQNLFSGGG